MGTVVILSTLRPSFGTETRYSSGRPVPVRYPGSLLECRGHWSYCGAIMILLMIMTNRRRVMGEFRIGYGLAVTAVI